MKKPLQEEPTKHVQTSSASCAGNKSNASQPPRPRVDLSEPPPAVLLIFTDSEDKQKRNNNKRTRRTEGAKGVVRPSSHRRLAVWLVAFQPTNQLAPPAHAASDRAPENTRFSPAITRRNLENRSSSDTLQNVAVYRCEFRTVCRRFSTGSSRIPGLVSDKTNRGKSSRQAQPVQAVGWCRPLTCLLGPCPRCHPPPAQGPSHAPSTDPPDRRCWYNWPTWNRGSPSAKSSTQHQGLSATRTGATTGTALASSVTINFWTTAKVHTTSGLGGVTGAILINAFGHGCPPCPRFGSRTY